MKTLKIPRAIWTEKFEFIHVNIIGQPRYNLNRYWSFFV